MRQVPLGSGDTDRQPRRAWVLANTVVTVEFVCFTLLGLPDILRTPLTPVTGTLCALGVAALLVVQLLYFGRPSTQLHSPLSHWLLLPQAAVVYLPLLLFGQGWIGMLAFSAGSVLLVLRPLPAWTAFAAVVASTWLVESVLGGSQLDDFYNTLSTALGGLAVFLLTRLARLVTELHAARSELARGAVAEERLRFARDLHDLLGLGLSAIALKGELAHRLLLRAPERAHHELVEIIDTARRGLADVRAVASGYRELSLEQEFQAARSLLADSDVDLKLDLDHRSLPVQVRTVLATVLREGVTNILRHSKVQHCEITVHQARDTIALDIVNDGVTGTLTPDPHSGNGLENLTARVAALGGTLVAGADGERHFRLHVELPAPDPGSASAARTPKHPQASPVGGRLATTVLTVVLLGFGLAATVHVLYLTTNPWEIALTIGFLAALLVLQLSFFSRPTVRLTGRQAWGLLFVQVCLVYLPLIELKQNWVSIPGLLICNALLVLRPTVGWSVSVAVLASVAWVHAGFSADIRDIPFNVLATVNTGFIAFGLNWLARLATELDTTRRRLAEVAVAEERLRFARDLHDLLGLSLSAITLKTELADRLLTADPDTASSELEEILALSRQALADVRSMASGFRELSLDRESRSAEAVLTAADVQVSMELDYGDLPANVGTVLAVVLREGVTNVLRHSRVEHCDIAVRRSGQTVCLEIVNDGVAHEEPLAAADTARSSGIRNLSDRVATLGGELAAGLEPDGRFRLRAMVPTA